MSLASIVALAYGVLAGTTFLFYGWDKWRAKRSGRRVPERTLHGLALLGGFLGAWLGMRVFRHKTQKPVFSVVLFLAAALHATAWGWWFYHSAHG
jgi:uncharacterized membrane protein YsdA (DUF1294 family)